MIIARAHFVRSPPKLDAFKLWVTSCVLLSCACGTTALEGGVFAADASLLEDAHALVFALTPSGTCADLINKSPAELASVKGIVTAQDGIFGKVTPDEAEAYLVLASTLQTADPTLADVEGTVFAMGCRQYTAVPDKRVDLAVTLFASGLR